MVYISAGLAPESAEFTTQLTEIKLGTSEKEQMAPLR